VEAGGAMNGSATCFGARTNIPDWQTVTNLHLLPVLLYKHTLKIVILQRLIWISVSYIGEKISVRLRLIEYDPFAVVHAKRPALYKVNSATLRVHI
jgi:hypothetical protein